MADADLKFGGCFGPHPNNLDPYFNSLPTNVGHHNDGTDDWIRNTGHSGTYTPMDSLDIDNLAYGWFVGRIHVETVGSVTAIGIAFDGSTNDSWLHLNRVSGTTWQFAFAESQGAAGTAGTATLNDGQEYIYRVEWGDGRFKLWIDGENGGNPDINEAMGGSDLVPDVNVLMLDNNLANTADSGFRWRNRTLILSESDNPGARPDLAPAVAFKYPDGDDVSATWADETCDTSSGATWTKWDDYNGGGHDDITTFSCGNTGTPGDEVSTLTDPTLADVFGIQGHTRVRANVAGKTVTWSTLIRDGAAQEALVLMGNLSGTTWLSRHPAIFRTDPNGDPWNQTRLDDLRWGYRHPSGNGAHVQVSAFVVEAAGLGSDPPTDAIIVGLKMAATALSPVSVFSGAVGLLAVKMSATPARMPDADAGGGADIVAQKMAATLGRMPDAGFSGGASLQALKMAATPARMPEAAFSGGVGVIAQKMPASALKPVSVFSGGASIVVVTMEATAGMPDAILSLGAVLLALKMAADPARMPAAVIVVQIPTAGVPLAFWATYVPILRKEAHT